MKPNLMLTCHLLCAGAWIGCLWTELAFERLLCSNDPALRLQLARLHWRVDRWVELPAMLGVLWTGAWMWPQGAATAALLGMAAVAGLAITANALCVEVVRQRLRAAQLLSAHTRAGERFDFWDRWQHRLGVAVFVGVHGAALIGLLRAAGLTA